MIQRKLTIRPINKTQENAYWEKRSNEFKERKINDYYQENKYTLIPLIIILTIISYPFIKIGEVYKYCKNKSCCNKVNPEIIKL